MPTLHFKGKTFVQNHHLAVKYHQLVPKADLSLTDKVSLHDNLIIQGDNLKALKALLPTYAGKIKCIYIDPPYNTGNEHWKYNDNVNSPMIQEWLGKEVAIDDLTRHDKWLCMMMPRLKLLRELLSEDGAIVINIENNEYSNLKLILDELFGEQNFIGCFIWRKKEGGGQTKEYFVTEHEYIIIYAKSNEFNWIDDTLEGDDTAFNKEDENGKYKLVKLAKWGNTARKEDRPKMHFPIYAPDGKKVIPYAPDGNLGRWRVGKARMDLLIESELIEFRKNEKNDWIAYEKIYFDENNITTIKERSILYDLTNTADASKQLTEIFGRKDEFDTPKPIDLVKYFISHISKNNDIILDSFAGSGTTAHAVLELNKEDGGNRSFILIEMEDYANSITAERVRRVIKGVPNAKSELLKNGTGGTFSYFQLGDAIEMESILTQNNLPSYIEFARYLFYTATGEEFNENIIDENTGFIGESKNYEVYLFYKPDIEWLKTNALTLEACKALPNIKNKQRLVFAPAKYVDDYTCLEYRIDFCQLPYEIYRIQK
ncbi:MAG: site-specific DNA-methyltransferase [Candidatus Paceibacterota bacterium]|jgi:adenine-specific DNA-methyltransferase